MHTFHTHTHLRAWTREGAARVFLQHAPMDLPCCVRMHGYMYARTARFYKEHFYLVSTAVNVCMYVFLYSHSCVHIHMRRYMHRHLCCSSRWVTLSLDVVLCMCRCTYTSMHAYLQNQSEAASTCLLAILPCKTCTHKYIHAYIHKACVQQTCV